MNRFLSKWLLSLVCLVVFMVLAVGSSDSGTKKTEKPARQVLCTVAFEKGAVIIKNDNDFDWTNARISLVRGMTLYTQEVGTIRKGEIKAFRMADFVSGSGEYFEAAKYKPQKVLVSADNAGGGREF